MDPKDKQTLEALQPKWTDEDRDRLDRELTLAQPRVDEIVDALGPRMPERLAEMFAFATSSFMTSHPAMSERLSRAVGTTKADHGEEAS